MSRGRKLLFVGLVLAVGFALAWPFRKTATDEPAEVMASSSVIDSKLASTRQPHVQAVLKPVTVGAPEPHVVAKMARMSESGTLTQGSMPTASFDLANHPAIAGHLAPRRRSPVTPEIPPRNQEVAKSYQPAQVQQDPSAARPAYRTIDRSYDAKSPRAEAARHVVQNSDTLEKLAKRYLGDASRALEIFDLNRDVLDNPHLLPIEAELRIPVDAGQLVD